MTTETSLVRSVPGEPAAELDSHWHHEVQTQLHPLENVLAALEVDLDARLHFARGLVLVTNQRVLSRDAAASGWQAWGYAAGLTLQHHDHAGVGHLELLDAAGLLASWRFTLGQNLHAIRLVDQFGAQLVSTVSGKPLAQALKNVCPSCKAPLEPDQEECPVCTKVVHTPPSTWTLFRLWRFAKPYRASCFWAFS
jgi:ATP-binding cassette subfamily B protein